MAHGFYSTGWSRAPEIRDAALPDMGAAGAADPTLAFTATRPSNVIPTMSMRGMRIRALGDTDGDSLVMVIFGIDTDHDMQPKYYSAMELGSATWTTGTLVHSVNLDKLSDPTRGTELYADTVTWVGTAEGNAHFSYANSSAITSSPTSNRIAEIKIPDLGNIWGIVLAFEEGTGTGATAGAMFKLDI